MIFGFGIWKLDDFGGTYDIGVSWCTIVPLRCCIPLCSCSILFLLIPPYFVDWSKWSSSSRLRHALFLRFPMTSGFWPIWPCLPHHLRSQSRSPFFGIGGLIFSMITWVWAWMHGIQWTRTHFFLVLELGLFLKILVGPSEYNDYFWHRCKVLKGGKVWCCSEAVYWCLTVYKATGCEAPVCPMACGSNPVSTEVCYAEGNAVVSSKWLDIARHVRFDGSPSQGTVQIWAELTLTTVKQSWDVQL